MHSLSKEAYLEANPGAVISCVSTKDALKARGQNFAWLKRAKERGDDLTAYKQKMGDAVRQSIMSNDDERARRGRLIGELNKREESRRRSSEAAKKTSARPEIVAQRSAQLEAWRKRDPEAFYEKCTRSMHTFKTSKPEKWVLAHVQSRYPEMGFKGNQQLRGQGHFKINSSGIRQIDIMSKSHKVMIEIDGYMHFNNVPQWNQLERVQAKDKELNSAAPLLGYSLVRISYDQWNQMTGELSQDCIDLLNVQLQFITPGVHTIGDMYPKKAFELLKDPSLVSIASAIRIAPV